MGIEPTRKWFDVHFSLNGFMKIEADSGEDAMEKAEEILNDHLGAAETAINTGLGVEVYEALEEQ